MSVTPFASRLGIAALAAAGLPVLAGCLGVSQRMTPPDAALATPAGPTTPGPDAAAHVPPPDGGGPMDASAGEGEAAGAATPTPAAPRPPLDPGPWDDATLGNLTYTFDGKPIALENGEYQEKPDAASATFVTNIRLGPQRAFGDLDGDGERDAAVILSDAPGGTGVFVYLAAVAARDGMPVNVAMASLGDRVAVDAVSIADGRVVLDVTTHEPQDPMCCPSLAATWVYRLDGDALVREAE